MTNQALAIETIYLPNINATVLANMKKFASSAPTARAVIYTNRKQADARVAKLNNQGVYNVEVIQPRFSVCFYVRFN